MYGEVNMAMEPTINSGDMCPVKPSPTTMQTTIGDIVMLSGELEDLCWKIDSFLFHSDCNRADGKREISCMSDAVIVSRENLSRTLNHFQDIASRLGL